MSAAQVAAQVLGPQHGASGSWLIYSCPACARPKCFVNPHTGGFVCHRCRHTGSIYKTFRRQDGWEPGEVLSLRPPTLEDIEAVPVYPYGPVRSYLRRVRGFTDKQISDFDVHESMFRGHVTCAVVNQRGEIVETKKKYVNANRTAIFPIYDGGYQGYQLRYIDDRDDGRRWLSCPGFRRKTSLFNADLALKHKVVFIAEGITSAAAFGAPNVIATFGKGWTDDQVNRMSSASAVKRFVIAYDADGLENSYKLATRLTAAGKQVKVVHFEEGEDPDECADLQARVSNAELVNYDTALLKSMSTGFDIGRLLYG